MTPEEFKEFGTSAINFVADYLPANSRNYPVLPSVSPGYLHHELPSNLPQDAEKWTQVMIDLKKHILPGLSHWQSPNFHADFPAQASYPSLCADILAAGMSPLGHFWSVCPAGHELEVIMGDWLARFLNLPVKFLSQEGPGGGIIQGTDGEAALVAILSAKEVVAQIVANGGDETKVRNSLVLYTSDKSSKFVKKDAKIAGVQFRALDTGEAGILSGQLLEEAVVEDLLKGNIPFFCLATMGTSATCAFDEVEELAAVCKRFKMFIHVDAGYAGGAFCLPEFSTHSKTLENVDSLHVNLYQLLNINFDCTMMWFTNAKLSEKHFNVEVYITTPFDNKWAPDLMHWQIPYGRRFRSLRVWFTLRILGGKKIREGIRERFKLAEYFQELLNKDERIQVISEAHMGVVTFCLKSGNEATKSLLNRLNERGKIRLSLITYSDKAAIRFFVGGHAPKEEDMNFAFNAIRQQI